MTKKIITPIDKAYTMFGRGEWVAESGKVKETRLIKELVEFAEAAAADAAAARREAQKNLSAVWRLENQEQENDALNGEIKILRNKLDLYNEVLTSIGDLAYSKRQ